MFKRLEVNMHRWVSCLVNFTIELLHDQLHPQWQHRKVVSLRLCSSSREIFSNFQSLGWLYVYEGWWEWFWKPFSGVLGTRFYGLALRFFCNLPSSLFWTILHSGLLLYMVSPDQKSLLVTLESIPPVSCCMEIGWVIVTLLHSVRWGSCGPFLVNTPKTNSPLF